MNLFEAILRFYRGREVFAPGDQLDGFAVHRVMASMFNGGDVDQGALIPWPYEAAMKMGILPPDTRITEIEPTLPAIVSALQDGPLLQGLWIGPAWSDANDVNGQIPEGWPMDFSSPDQGGHETVMTGYEPRGGVDWLAGVNSWGQGFGWKGTFVISFQEWRREHAPMGDGPYQLIFNPHSVIKWDGWMKYVIRKKTVA